LTIDMSLAEAQRSQRKEKDNHHTKTQRAQRKKL